ncbi:hypothetical protein [Hymenobacter persicinus]|uniref:Uncharacterized protein n=1 Tax=Hymenobacter persicinus TaxID=2025506 RepID=A0A4Q5L7E1_9BACT|nr:hypothetical protein [Hymenobacter persicinus]RYU76729.1 hypothetical protein EWM57_18210 [Hymenobacter persicinus]
MSELVHTISELEFTRAAAIWAEQASSEKIIDFFKKGSSLQVGVLLNYDSANLLFSTMGISTIKIRFGGQQDEQGTYRFALILFGEDAYGQRVTPYYNPQQGNYKDVSLIQGEPGNLPTELAKQWMQHWEGKGAKDDLNAGMFGTIYGFLQGYNYPVKEFMSAMQGFEAAPDILISFGLHRYLGVPKEASSAAEEVVYTFGLLFNAVQAAGPVAGLAAPVEESGYFDLTAPCPRTC